MQKLLAEYRAGHVEEAILLVDAATETNWFHSLYDFPMCFVRGRIHFVSGDGKRTSGQIQGSVFVYLGHHTDTFVRVFVPLGRMYVPLPPILQTT